MTKDVVTAKPGIGLEEAKQVLKNNRIEKLPIVDDDRPVSYTHLTLPTIYSV